jgi:hypothetical protein
VSPLPAGLLVTALAVLIFQGLGGEVATRYYLPVIVLVALAGVVMLAEAPARLAGVAIGAALLLAAADLPDAHRAVEEWAAREKADARVLESVRALNPAGCPVYVVNFELEARVAIASLVPARSTGTCAAGEGAVLLESSRGATDTNGASILGACPAPGWRRFAAQDWLVAYRCARLGGDSSLRAQRLIPNPGVP